MRRPPIGLLFLSLVLAGCAASGQDPWAYAKKPLYTGGFDLEKVAGSTDSQVFRVTDGSIGAIKVFVWINATVGGGSVSLHAPSGRTVMSADQTTQTQLGLDLGEWKVVVTGEPESQGSIHVLVVRA